MTFHGALLIHQVQGQCKQLLIVMNNRESNYSVDPVVIICDDHAMMAGLCTTTCKH